jgi:hypothetical protein
MLLNFVVREQEHVTLSSLVVSLAVIMIDEIGQRPP